MTESVSQLSPTDPPPQPSKIDDAFSPPPVPWYVRYRFLLLLAITALGGAVRFATLSLPPLWGDEALTYSRVFGTFDELMQILRDDGFMPLNYYIYYWIQHGLPIGSTKLAPDLSLTPAVMRFVPALCGTLMIPAMYFATRALASVRASLLAAGFACCSAYLMAYSHDAKMYIQCWLFVTLNLACLWWWLRSTGWIAWVAWGGWIVAGLIAMGFHIAAVLLLIPQPVLLLTHPKAMPRQLFLMAVGFLLLAAAPYSYYRYFNQWNVHTGGIMNPASAQGNWDSSGISWIDEFNRGLPGSTLLWETASAYLIGTEWTNTPRAKHIVTAKTAAIVGSAFLATLSLVMLGALPWRRPWKKTEPTANPDPPAQEGWRVLLWLGMLLIIPAYGFFYCRSVHDYALPVNPGWLIPLLPIVLAAIYFSGYTNRERVQKLLRFGPVFAVLAGVFIAITWVWGYRYAAHWAALRAQFGAHVNAEVNADLDWKSIWMPRYVGVVWPVMGMAVSILVSRLPSRWLRWTAIVVLLGVNSGNAVLRLVAGTQPPHPRIFADLRDARDNRTTQVVLASVDPSQRGVQLWLYASNFGIYGDAGRYYACMTLGLKTNPFDFRSGQLSTQYRDIAGEVISAAQIPRVVNSDTQRLVIWERYPTNVAATPADLPESENEITQPLGGRWKPIHDPEVFYLRSWHEWGDMGWMRRWEFVSAQ